MGKQGSSLSEARALARHAEHVVPAEELEARLGEGRPLRVKLGVDPTVGDITLGWAVPLRKLRAFQDQGHTAVLIMGDFTARIGDPSGKSATRPQLPPEVVRANAEACVAQLLDILSVDNLEVRYNSEWLEPMDLTGVLELTASYTVAQMLEREDFSKRYGAHQPISVSEFLYPLLQGYDSIAVDADVELGGSDQLFNLLVARDLQKAYGRRPQIAMTMPLLVGLDGTNKMSQSLGNYVAIRDAPEDMFGKLMSVPDRLTGNYAALAAGFDDDSIEAAEAAAARGGPGAGDAKRRVARAIVELYHGRAGAEAAEAAFDATFKRHELPEEIPTARLPEDSVKGDDVYLPAALAGLGLTSSRGEAKKLIAGGGVRLDGVRLEAENIALSEVAGAVLQVGRRRFVRIAAGAGRAGPPTRHDRA